MIVKQTVTVKIKSRGKSPRPPKLARNTTPAKKK